MKKFLITLGVVSVLLLVGFTYVSARFVDRGKIAQLQTEQAQLTRQRDSILAFARTRDSLQGHPGGLGAGAPPPRPRAA
jgi:hypothetical protein